jgi:hypothetical protein
MLHLTFHQMLDRMLDQTLQSRPEAEFQAGKVDAKRNVGCEKPCRLKEQPEIEGGFLNAAHHCRVMGLLSSQAEGPGSRCCFHTTEIGLQELGCKALAAFGAACVDHSAATTCFHANQETMSACAACFGRLISAFHFESFLITAPKALCLFLGETGDYRKLYRGWQTLTPERIEKNGV